MITLGYWGEASEATAVSQILRAGSQAQAAVDRRVRLLVYPYVLDAITNSAVLRVAAQIAIDYALEQLGISTPHVEVDDDGGLYIDPGSRTAQVDADADGTPAIFP